MLRDEYVLNGGNPTSGSDPNEVVGGNDGNPSDRRLSGRRRPDENYDLDGVYNLGYNRSPNGAIEYTGNAFGSNLKGAILFAQFSTGDNVRMIRVDATGNIIGDDVLRRPDGSVINNYIDPLDIIQNPVTGQLYLMTLNRGTGASQLILLTPAPGGVTEDVTADEGGDLALVAFDVTDPSAAVFQINGLDDDITAIRVKFNSGAETTVTLDAQNRFTIDSRGLTGTVTATIRVTDDDLNDASVSTTFTPGEEPETPDSSRWSPSRPRTRRRPTARPSPFRPAPRRRSRSATPAIWRPARAQAMSTACAPARSASTATPTTPTARRAAMRISARPMPTS